jgi:hypothetical protein
MSSTLAAHINYAAIVPLTRRCRYQWELVYCRNETAYAQPMIRSGRTPPISVPMVRHPFFDWMKSNVLQETSRY